jgi:hypothetical protein
VDCQQYGAELGPNNLAACSDGQDNDGDGLTDGTDPRCTDAYGDSEASAMCTDWVDNDFDGWIDAADADCHNNVDELASQDMFYECSNGTDDDNNGVADHSDDYCSFGWDIDESDGCANDLDDDNDGWTDWNDPDCDVGGPESGLNSSYECNNAQDDDGDQLTDGDDTDCPSAIEREYVPIEGPCPRS